MGLGQIWVSYLPVSSGMCRQGLILPLSCQRTIELCEGQSTTNDYLKNIIIISDEIINVKKVHTDDLSI